MRLSFRGRYFAGFDQGFEAPQVLAHYKVRILTEDLRNRPADTARAR